MPESPDFEIERANVRPGVAPSSCWMAVQLDEGGTSLVALVGELAPVLAYAEAMGRRGHLVPVGRLRFPGGALGIALLGRWPSYEDAQSVVRKITRIQVVRKWARAASQALNHPRFQDPGYPDEETTRSLASLYLGEIRSTLN